MAAPYENPIALFIWGKNELYLINLISYCEILTGIIVLLILPFVNAPYGRYSDGKWGWLIPARIAWFVQELPSFVFPLVLIYVDFRGNIVNLVLLMSLILHYFQRTFIFPFLIRGGKPTPFLPFSLAFLFCLGNGYIQGRQITRFSIYDENDIFRPNFIIGMVLFLSGMIINLHSDHILRNLRKPGETGYKIPRGGMFEYVSGANYFGETLEWFGFAVACLNLPAIAFSIFTACNIGPRAYSHHRMYLEKFEDYPKNRKAIIPFLL